MAAGSGRLAGVIDFTPYLPPSRGGRLHRWASAAEAIAAIPEGARIFIGGGALVATVVLQELADQRERYARLEVVTAGLTKGLQLAEDGYKGLVIWSKDGPFSAGADLQSMMPAFMQGRMTGRKARNMPKLPFNLPPGFG